MSRFDREPPWHIAFYAYGAVLLWCGTFGLIGGWAVVDRAAVSIIAGIALLIVGRHLQRRYV